ncbi:MAG: HAD family hydrolase [Candidatus Sifarchaeia archaeon]|jgi:putative hydrolase of the HAD superfamily
MEKGKRVAAIFDFDGTLVESHPQRSVAHLKVCESLLKHLNLQGSIKKEVLLNLISQMEIEMNEKHFYDRNIWWKEAVKRYFSKDISMSESTLTELTTLYWQTVSDESKVFPKAEDLLISLREKGIQLGLMSDTDGLKNMKAKRITESGLREYFDQILVPGEDTHETKPSTQPFIKICEKLGVAPQNAVHVGDNPQVDISGARELGMKTIILTPDKTRFKEKILIPDYLIELKDIKKLEDLIPELLNLV